MAQQPTPVRGISKEQDASHDPTDGFRKTCIFRMANQRALEIRLPRISVRKAVAGNPALFKDSRGRNCNMHNAQLPAPENCGAETSSLSPLIRPSRHRQR